MKFKIFYNIYCAQWSKIWNLKKNRIHTHTHWIQNATKYSKYSNYIFNAKQCSPNENKTINQPNSNTTTFHHESLKSQRINLKKKTMKRIKRCFFDLHLINKKKKRNESLQCANFNTWNREYKRADIFTSNTQKSAKSVKIE